MRTYVEFTDYSLFLDYVCADLGIDLLTVLLDSSTLGCSKIRLQNLNQLEQHISTGGGFFGEEISKPTLIVDISDIEITKNNSQYLDKATQGQNVYIYSSTNETIDADTKKLLKKHDFEIESLKKLNENTANTIANQYQAKINLKLSATKLNTLTKQATSYTEILDNLDFLALCGDAESGYRSLLKTEKVALFMMGFDPKDTSCWYNNVAEDDLQLALSLIYGKLEKSGNKLLLQDLIQTDQSIKTRAKISPLTWYRLFLWKAQNLI